MKKVFSFTVLLLMSVIALISCGGSDSKDTASHVNRIMLFSSNWGDDSIRITDDINSLADGATAAPRVIAGFNVPLTDASVDSLAVDRSRDMIYITDSATINIIVYHNAKTANGDIAPDRTITISTASGDMTGIAVDSIRDRLYIAGYNGNRCVFILNNASTLSGTRTADAVLSIPPTALFIDQQNDRLYVGKCLNNIGAGEVYVFDNASTLTSGSTPDRTITLPTDIPAHAIWVDAATNKLYYGSRNQSASGYNLFIFNGASILNGSYDPDIDSIARIPLEYLMSAMVDNEDRLYIWEDSATNVKIYNNASSLSGNVTAPPDKTITGVVNSGYGLDYLSY